MIDFNASIQRQFKRMCDTGKLFRSSLTGQELWDLYIKGFKPEYDPIFRDPKSTTHNCNHCNNFIRRYGNIVAIDENYNIMTLFDVTTSEEYQDAANILSHALKSKPVANIFVETLTELKLLRYESLNNSLNQFFRLGVSTNEKRYTKAEANLYPQTVKPNEIRTFHHFHLDVPSSYIDKTGDSEESIMAEFRQAKEVFQRGMEELNEDTLNLVIDLINQGSILNGTSHLYKVVTFLELMKAYNRCSNKDNYCWLVSYHLSIAKFKNELIGVLCTDLAQGKDLNESCKACNIRIDPANYMKAKAPITTTQINNAKAFIEENGYEASFDRRYATIEDIKVSEILHINNNSNEIKTISIFDSVKSTNTRHKKAEFDDIERVSIDQFMKDILPRCTSVEAFVSSQHEGNFMSLTTSNVKDSKPIFKYSNNYSQTFNGNLAGKSEIKQAVKSAGGNVDGVLRFSIIWNEEGYDNSDLDAWCEQPNKERIGFNTGFRRDRGNYFSSCRGQLDLDNRCPGGKLAVENIYFVDLKALRNGVYKFWVNQFAAANSKGFKAELDVDGELYTYHYSQPVSQNHNVMVVEVTVKDGSFSVKSLLPETRGSKSIYGLETNEFHKVNLVCLSPNHWNNENIGNKHYLFILDECICPNPIRSFHAEDLIPELAQHRKVLEVLSQTTMIQPLSVAKNKINPQLSGLGFNATVRSELVVKLQGSFKRTLKIEF